MKCKLITLLSLLSLSLQAANYPLTTNANLFGVGDSLEIDGSSTSPQTGLRHWPYIYSSLLLYYPTYNLNMMYAARSGGTPADFFTMITADGTAFWGSGFNHNQHVGFYYAGDGGGLNSNQMFYAISNAMQFPLWGTNGTDANEQQAGWCSTNTVEWIGYGPPPASATGGDFQLLHSYAMTNAGPRFGVVGIDIMGQLLASWAVQYTLDNGAANLNVVQAPDPKEGHYLNGASYSWATPIIYYMIQDTNVSTAEINWDGTIVDTNHCTLTSVSKSGDSLFFTRLDQRIPGGFDVPGTNIYGETITNDVRGAFVTRPEDAVHFQFTMKVDGLPSGLYEVYMNGILSATLSSSILSSAHGWNMFTNYAGPYWNKRVATLHDIRILAFANPVTLISGSAGGGEGIVSYMSTVGSLWPANRGDALITAMATKNTQLGTNYTAIHATSQMAPVDWELRLVSPSVDSPVPFR